MQQAQISNSLTLVRPRIHNLVKIIAGSLFIALCAQISIPLPFTPVPLTFQTLAILFLGISLGSRQAAACTLLYLLEVVSGFPFLAGDVSKPLVFFGGSTAGYLLAMPFLAYIAGKASAQKPVIYNMLILAVASLFLLIAGTSVLASFAGWKQALYMGLYPFLPGDALKVLIVTFYLAKNKNFE